MKFNVELVTPEELVVSADYEMVVVPGETGDFGVLKGHSPIISSLRPGIIDLYDNEHKIAKRVFVAEGFAEVTPERCTILARNAKDVTSRPEEAARLIEEANAV